MHEEPGNAAAHDEIGRRGFVIGSTALMTAGLAGGYGMFCHMAGRFLYPAHDVRRRWVFVANERDLKSGDSIAWRTPAGVPIAVTRKAQTGGISDFVALGS